MSQEKQEIIEILPSVLAETAMEIDGTTPNFDYFKPTKYIIDGPKSNLLLKCGRQTSKSTALAVSMIISAKFLRGFRQGYIGPTSRAATSFSILRFSTILSSSKALWKNFYSPKNTDKSIIDNVGLKKFKNNSVCVFLYADADPDRIRGFTFDRIMFDEVQDIDLDMVYPVVEACIMNSMYRERMFMGTPKSLDNNIELLWDNSTQHEWAVKCESCGKYNIFVSTKTIGKDGPICAKCGKSIDTRNGVFVPMNNPGKSIVGYHIARTALPLYMYRKEAWQDHVVRLLDDPLWTQEKFQNEILGISAGTGLKLITEKDLLDIATYDIDPYDINSLKNAPGEKFIGIDWGGTDYTLKLEDVQSQTAIVVYNLLNSNLNICYYKVFSGIGPLDILDQIKSIIQTTKPLSVAADSGGGKVENSELTKLCVSNRILFLPIQWGSFDKKFVWNNIDKYLADKTTMFDSYFYTILDKNLIRLPSKNNKQIIYEFLSEHAEITNSNKKIWKRIKNKTDDLLHAAVFGWLGFKIAKKDFNLYNGISMNS